MALRYDRSRIRRLARKAARRKLGTRDRDLDHLSKLPQPRDCPGVGFDLYQPSEGTHTARVERRYAASAVTSNASQSDTPTSAHRQPATMKLSDEEAFGEDSRETSRGSSPWQVVGGSAGYADGHGAGGDAYDEDGKLEGEEEHGLLGERMVGRSTQEDTYPPHSPRNSDDGVMLPKRSMELPRSPSFSSRPTSAFVRALVIETSPSLLLSMVGGVLTGVLLESMQGWTVFIRVEELFILTPVVMNLKGNLEMNLAARLSTAVRRISSCRPSKADPCLLV